MADRFLTDFELLVMLAVLRVRDDAYGVPIARAIEEHTGRTVTLAAVYLALDTGLEDTLEAGLYPFVVGDLLKLYLAGALLPGAWALVRRFKG